MKQAIFYPGPSRVYSNITEYIYEAYMEGIMSINHRSEAFMTLMEDTKSTLRQKLLIPEDYEIVFASSATECWEIIAQSLTKKKSHHFFNGAFGEKWSKYASELKDASSTAFGLEELLPSDYKTADVDVICVTQNETSNGTQVSMEVLSELRKNHSDKILAVDATSSMAGVVLDYGLADVWFASVQKCFGLPAGMGIMLLSPAAIERCNQIGEKSHYNSLSSILENAAKNQTSCTPNVLNIYLLNKTQKVSKGIAYNQEKLERRKGIYEMLFSNTDGIEYLVKNEACRSLTVQALTVKNPDEVKSKALERGIVLGNGYGPWKSGTFRIANFPAIKSKEVEKLVSFFEKYY